MEIFQGINLSRLGDLKNKNVLDYGCGDGTVASFFIKKGCTVVGVDINPNSEAMVLSKINESESEFFTFYLLDAEKETITSNQKFDLIICREVLEHIVSYEKIISQFTNLLQQDGIIVISVPTYLSEKFYLFCDHKWLQKSEHVNIFKRSELTIALNQNGFDVTSVEGQSFRWTLFWMLLSPLKVDHKMGNPINNFTLVRITLKLVNLICFFEFVEHFGNHLFPKSHFYYLVKHKPRILIIYDYSDWILYKWATNIVRMFSFKYDFILMSMFHANKKIGYTKRLIKKVDVIHLLLPHSFELFHKLNHSKPIITTTHHWMDWNSVANAAKESSFLITGSNQWRDRLVDHFIDPEKICVMHSGVDNKYFEKRERLLEPSAKMTIGFFAKRDSNEQDRKGTRHLIKVIEELINMHHQDKFKLVISGEGWSDFALQCREKGFEVIDVGFVSDENMPSLYRSLDVYLMLSDVEGGPVTIIEAMASNCIVLSTNIGLSRDILVDGQNAIIVDGDNSSEIAEKLLFCLYNKEEINRIKQNAFGYVKKYMTFDHTFKHLDTVYDKQISIISKIEYKPIDLIKANTHNQKNAEKVNK